LPPKTSSSGQPQRIASAGGGIVNSGAGFAVVLDDRDALGGSIR